ncbi:hypothetical protein PAXRUDRAFT_830159 [Paxillus rubicundulus Ve08.2h10]|uniref:Uncharacterized protein n=1 Tax=Paxillus rubicundulus Ve08.2h10 TaxID=930991 RepID=A0A0D0DLK9_9AGAM|nr:hypothetical protein PAXRUDRAFT_830159 [Paxillus rubicundulus Ve08.2h10]
MPTRVRVLLTLSWFRKTGISLHGVRIDRLSTVMTSPLTTPVKGLHIPFAIEQELGGENVPLFPMDRSDGGAQTIASRGYAYLCSCVSFVGVNLITDQSVRDLAVSLQKLMRPKWARV